MKIKFSKKNIVLCILILSTISNVFLFYNFNSNKDDFNAYVKNDIVHSDLNLDSITHILKIGFLNYDNLTEEYHYCIEISIYLNNIRETYQSFRGSRLTKDEGSFYFRDVGELLMLYSANIKGLGLTAKKGSNYVNKEEFEQYKKELIAFAEILRSHNEYYKSNMINKVDYIKLHEELKTFIKTTKTLSDYSIYKHLF